MRHVAEPDLVLLHYGELAEPERALTHLAACERCRDAYAELERFLATVETRPVPERDPGYPERVWQRVAARLESAPERHAPRTVWPAWLAWPRLATAGALAVVIGAAFWIGREHGRSDLGLSAEQRERILLFAVGEHLARSERMLRELANTPPAGAVDLGQKPVAADRLAADNRLYRATARHAGLEQLALLLDDLERVLVDIANSPGTVSGPEFNALWRRIETSGLLIKIRIAESESRRDVLARPAARANEI